MIGKKAGVFAISMVIGMIIFISLSWHAFSITNRNLNLGISKTITNNEDVKDRFIFYITESSKLAAAQAFHEIAKHSAGNDDCKVIENKIIWNDECKPDQKSLKDEFLKRYNSSFIGFIKNYPEENLRDIEYFYLIENDKLISVASKKTLNSIKEETFVTYNISSEFDASSIINLTELNIKLDDFGQIYEEAQNAITECRDSNNISSCVQNKLSFKRWQTEVKKEGSYLIFKCQTKNYFFFDDSGEKFEPITLDFAMAII